MNRSVSTSRIMLLAGSTSPSPSASGAGVAVKRYRLARARLDARPSFGRRVQSSPSDSARASRSDSLFMS
jgi:hypothetical protein